jgi:hypothetical protein
VAVGEQLESVGDGAGEERHDQLVEADAPVLGRVAECEVEGERDPDEDPAVWGLVGPWHGLDDIIESVALPTAERPPRWLKPRSSRRRER